MISIISNEAEFFYLDNFLIDKWETEESSIKLNVNHDKSTYAGDKNNEKC